MRLPIGWVVLTCPSTSEDPSHVPSEGAAQRECRLDSAGLLLKEDVRSVLTGSGRVDLREGRSLSPSQRDGVGSTRDSSIRLPGRPVDA
jgi:hypothetical protein